MPGCSAMSAVSRTVSLPDDTDVLQRVQTKNRSSNTRFRQLMEQIKMEHDDAVRSIGRDKRKYEHKLENLREAKRQTLEQYLTLRGINGEDCSGCKKEINQMRLTGVLSKQFERPKSVISVELGVLSSRAGIRKDNSVQDSREDGEAYFVTKAQTLEGGEGVFSKQRSAKSGTANKYSDKTDLRSESRSSASLRSDSRVAGRPPDGNFSDIQEFLKNQGKYLARNGQNLRISEPVNQHTCGLTCIELPAIYGKPSLQRPRSMPGYRSRPSASSSAYTRNRASTSYATNRSSQTQRKVTWTETKPNLAHTTNEQESPLHKVTKSNSASKQTRSELDEQLMHSTKAREGCSKKTSDIVSAMMRESNYRRSSLPANLHQVDFIQKALGATFTPSVLNSTGDNSSHEPNSGTCGEH